MTRELTQRLPELPILGVGPGCHVEDEALVYLPMPQGMSVYRAPVLPEPAELQAHAAACDVLRALRSGCSAAQRGEATAPIELGGLPAADRQLLGQLLGEGEVSAVVLAPDQTRLVLQVQESVFAGIFRVVQLADDGVVRDWLEVGPLPRILLDAARSDGQRLGATPVAQVPPDGAMNGPAILAELAHHWRAGADAAAIHVINLTLLPLSAADGPWLDDQLGAGSVTVLSRGYGNCRISSTGRPRTWRLTYFNSQDTVILSTIEVSDVPEVACAAIQDFADSAARLGELLAWVETP
ncbi:MAG: hydrogenase expression/formation protein [Polyangiales bacterium]